MDVTAVRPEICLGTDGFHTPKTLIEAAISAFESAGFETGLNTPFAGTLVPLRYYRNDKQVRSLMIEIRRDLYMDENSGKKLPGFARFRERLCDCVREINEIYATLEKGYQST